MSVSVWHAVRAAANHHVHHPVACRFVAGRRLPSLQQRTIHTAPSRRRKDEDGSVESPLSDTKASKTPLAKADTTTNQPPQDTNDPAGDFEHQRSVGEPPADDGTPDGRPQKPSNSNTGNYGSASRRAGRNVKRREIPPVFIPPWFYERNVVTWDAGGESRNDFKIETSSISGSEVAQSIDPAAEEGQSPGSEEHESEETGSEEQSHTCMVSDVINGEISSLIHAGLKVPASGNPVTVASIKPHIVFACPKKGASGILDAIVSNYAQQNEADLLRLAPQDIAEIGGDYLEDPTSFRSSTLSSLAYDTAAAERYEQQPPQASSHGQADEEDFEEVEEGEEGEEEGAQPQGMPRSFASQAGGMHVTAHVVPAFVGAINLDDLFKSMKKPGDPSTQGAGPSPSRFNGRPVLQVRDDTENMKTFMLIESLLNAPEIKRYSPPQQNETALEARQDGNTHRGQSTGPVFHPERGSRGLIVLVEDYPQISMTLKGSRFLEKLHEVVNARRKEGQSVLIVGTSSSEKTIAPGHLKSSINDVQSQSWNGAARTVLVPIKNLGDGDVMPRANRARISEINARHLRDMLRRIAPVPEQVQNIVSDLDWQFPATLMSSAEENVLSLDEINRIATIALGMARQSESLTFSHITNSISLIKGSDASKHSQLKEQQTASGTGDPFTETKPPQPDQQQTDAKMKKLRKTCNSYEKKLLNGVVDPTNIRTTFADVRAPPETIEALQTLTSLSLVRPEAFTYGVLSTDRIPGLLLYGPPGTGKTLLAKAVAKQANATVLEVSGSDVYDMYVGEGEKNVKAIFTLAKKLSPCIVFIDEADAILGARSSGHGRASHRELINQFLREWDGMSTDMNAFIMVATNRPFDLDEASLRRLPRRLLVDLPVEKDREAILRIHLKDELLDPEVAIPPLAANTPFYSGSDLKNLCVAAALSCVQEEFDTATRHNNALPSSSSSSSSSSLSSSSNSTDDPEADASSEAKGEAYQYPAKRTLHQRHFNKAMEEISASISEDMGSLGAIRKFDEKYGDRKGRRKKLAGGYGFKKADGGEREGSERVRVRNQS